VAETKKFPEKLGDCIDALYKMRAKRQVEMKKLNDREDALKAEEKALGDHIINTFTKAELEGGRGKVAVANMVPHIYPKPVDWDKFYAYLVKTKAFDLLERRISKTAFRARHEAGKEVPGVEAFLQNELSLTKR
jgi:hypothetical protein